MPEYSLYVGVDIASQSASVAWMGTAGSDQPPFTITQSQAGADGLIRRLRATGHPPTCVLIVMEATGTYWMRLATRLHRAGFVVSVVNPAQAHYFARALLQHTKTDALDARMLARLARALQPAPWSPPPAEGELLQQLLVQREALLHMRTQERCRQHALLQRAAVAPAVRQRSERLLRGFEAELEQIGDDIRGSIAAQPTWATNDRLLRSIPGIGPVTAAWLIAATHNFSLCPSADSLVAYAGLAPHIRQSGSSLNSAGSVGQGGHWRLRGAFYMAAVVAIRHNPVLKIFYDRLVERGKPRRVALLATARKLLVLSYALVRDGVSFRPVPLAA